MQPTKKWQLQDSKTFGIHEDYLMIKMTRWLPVLILIVACAAATPPALPPTSTPTATPVATVPLPGPTVPPANAPTVTPAALAPTSLPAASPVEWAGRNRGDPNAFSKPTGLALDAQGNLYVVDGGNARIQKFGPDGRFITSWGSAGIGDGEFHFLGGVLWGGSSRSAGRRLRR